MSLDPVLTLPRLRWTTARGGEPGVRAVPEETPVAIVHDGTTTAVMMATPADLEDFAIGFSLTEGIAGALADIRDVEVVEQPLGVEVRLWLAPGHAARLAARRRRLAGATGCGLCGVDSLEEAVRAPPAIPASDFRVAAADLLAAMEDLTLSQALGQATRALHAAALWRPGQELAVREDVGRHNALDKLVGALARHSGSRQGVLLLTSRVSVEMVQKAAVLAAPVLCAVSAPTALAVRTAQACGLTLVAVTRADGFEVFTHPERIVL